MGYYIDDEKITLDELGKRIKDTDLIPSRALLLDTLSENIIALQKSGILSLADFRKETKNAKSISLLADKTKICLATDFKQPLNLHWGLSRKGNEWLVSISWPM